MWGPLTNQDLLKWEKHPLEALHAELCKNILRVHRHTANNACRAELGQYPLIIKIQKRAIKFHKHLQSSDPDSYQYKALQCQELNKDRSPLCQLVLKLCPHTPDLQDRHQTIWPNQIISKQKENYIKYWKETTKSQSKLEFYLTLNREYMVAEYLTTVTDIKLRKTLTMYRLAIETGRHRQNRLPREARLCSLCHKREVETESHFLLHCEKYGFERDFL